jgi:hypothetical protein
MNLSSSSSSSALEDEAITHRASYFSIPMAIHAVAIQDGILRLYCFQIHSVFRLMRSTTSITGGSTNRRVSFDVWGEPGRRAGEESRCIPHSLSLSLSLSPLYRSSDFGVTKCRGESSTMEKPPSENASARAFWFLSHCCHCCHCYCRCFFFVIWW